MAVEEVPAGRRRVVAMPAFSIGLLLKLVALVVFILGLLVASGHATIDLWVLLFGGLAAWVLSEIVP